MYNKFQSFVTVEFSSTKVSTIHFPLYIFLDLNRKFEYTFLNAFLFMDFLARKIQSYFLCWHIPKHHHYILHIYILHIYNIYN